MSSAAIVVIAVAAVLGLWMLGAYNRLVRLRQTLAAAFALVDAQLRLRHELLAELIDTASAALADTPEAVAALEAARLQTRIAADRAARRPASAGRLASLALAEQVLRTALSRLVTLVQARPALRSDAKLREALKKISATQTRLAAERHTFNAIVLDYNRSVRQFPTRLAAAIFGFRAAGPL